MIKPPAMPCGLSYRPLMPAGPRPSSSGAIRLKRRQVRGRAGALMLFACLLIAGCAQKDRGSEDENRSGGFYGGVSGGLTR